MKITFFYIGLSTLSTTLQSALWKNMMIENLFLWANNRKYTTSCNQEKWRKHVFISKKTFRIIKGNQDLKENQIGEVYLRPNAHEKVDLLNRLAHKEEPVPISHCNIQNCLAPKRGVRIQWRAYPGSLRNVLQNGQAKRGQVRGQSI